MLSTEWGSYAYHIMPFGLKDAPFVFSRIIIIVFRDYIHRFLEVYIDDWIFYNLLKKHSSLLRVMFDRCRQLQISLNMKKCIFAVLFGALLGHIICKDNVCVDSANTMFLWTNSASHIHNFRKNQNPESY